MYKINSLITLLFILFSKILLVKSLICDIYNYDYYYIQEISNISITKFNNSREIFIDNKPFYINDYNTTVYMGSAKIKNKTETYIINMLNKENSYTKKYNYAIGSHNNKLKKWISIAGHSIDEYGEKVFIEEFNGFKLPNNIQHNGCFRFDDITEHDKLNGNDCFIRIFTGEKIFNSDIKNSTITIVKNSNCSLMNYQ